MKHPDRKRKRARSERVEPLPPLPGGPLQPVPLPELPAAAAPASPSNPPPAASPPPGAPVASPSRRRPSSKPLALAAILAVSGAVGLVASRITSQSKPPSAPRSTPTPAPVARGQRSPMPVLSPLEPLKALPTPAPLPSLRPPERVVPEKRVPGNGYPLLLEALARIETASVTATHEIQRAAASPGTPLGVEGLKFVRASWPAIQELEQAGRAETFAAVGSQTLDFGRLDAVVSAALAIAHMESATRVPLGREAIRMARVGHALAGSGALLDSALGLAQARKAEKWLRTSLEKEPWNVEELAWIAGELDGLAVGRSISIDNISTGSDDRAEKRRAALAKALDAEKQELFQLCKLAHDKAAAAGKKGT